MFLWFGEKSKVCMKNNTMFFEGHEVISWAEEKQHKFFKAQR